MNNVLYVPKLAYNLFSIPQSMKNGKSVIIHEGGCEIKEKEGRTIASGVRKGSLYYLSVASETANVVSVGCLAQATWSFV